MLPTSEKLDQKLQFYGCVTSRHFVPSARASLCWGSIPPTYLGVINAHLFWKNVVQRKKWSSLETFRGTLKEMQHKDVFY